MCVVVSAPGVAPVKLRLLSSIHRTNARWCSQGLLVSCELSPMPTPPCGQDLLVWGGCRPTRKACALRSHHRCYSEGYLAGILPGSPDAPSVPSSGGSRLDDYVDRGVVVLRGICALYPQSRTGLGGVVNRYLNFLEAVFGPIYGRGKPRPTDSLQSPPEAPREGVEGAQALGGHRARRNAHRPSYCPQRKGGGRRRMPGDHRGREAPGRGIACGVAVGGPPGMGKIAHGPPGIWLPPAPPVPPCVPPPP